MLVRWACDSSCCIRDPALPATKGAMTQQMRCPNTTKPPWDQQASLACKQPFQYWSSNNRIPHTEVVYGSIIHRALVEVCIVVADCCKPQVYRYRATFGSANNQFCGCDASLPASKPVDKAWQTIPAFCLAPMQLTNWYGAVRLGSTIVYIYVCKYVCMYV